MLVRAIIDFPRPLEGPPGFGGAPRLPGGDWRRIQKADGYRWILVNGQVSIEDGEPTGVLSGKLLRHGKE